MFSVEDRNHIRDHVLQLAASDARVVAGAVVGSLALSEGDRWSDLDLTFAVAEDAPLPDVLEDWTRDLVKEFDAVHLFDLPSGASIYRVFLLPGCLQFDLSFTPGLQIWSQRPEVQAALRQCRGKALRSTAVRAGTLWLCSAPRAARTLLHRTRPHLAGRVLDQRCSRLRHQPRLSPPRTSGSVRQGV